MTIHDPARAPRQRDHGYKGDAWSADTPPVGSKPVLLLDSGLDSVAILRMPNDAWDRSTAPTTVRAHLGYDETILIPRGNGTLYHGTDPGDIAASRFEAPVTVVLPAGIWHSVAMDEGVVAEGTAFFTVPGTVIEPFAIQMEIVARGRVTFSELPVVHPEPVRARDWTGPAWPKVPTAPSVGAEERPLGRRRPTPGSCPIPSLATA